MYVASAANHRVRKIDVAGTITTIAGTGDRGLTVGSASGSSGGFLGPATGQALYSPYGIAADGVGNVYVADTLNDRVLMIDPQGIGWRIAGTRDPRGFSLYCRNPRYGRCPESGIPLEAILGRPSSLAADGSGNVFVDHGPFIHKITVFSRIAKFADLEDSFENVFYEDESEANFIKALAVDGSGNVFVGVGTTGGQILKANAEDGSISVIAGTGEEGFSGDSGPAGSARLSVSGLAVDQFGNVWFTDYHSGRIRVLEPFSSGR